MAGRYRNRVEFKVCIHYGRRLLRKVDIETEWNLKFTKPITEYTCFMVDIETEWNLKLSNTTLSFSMHLLVDIETEWNLKIVAATMGFVCGVGRYRNRVEFKARMSTGYWNLLPFVDIETEWNLKTHSADGKNTYYRVDIETEWNLKAVACNAACIAAMRRYRNRVEFKASSAYRESL